MTTVACGAISKRRIRANLFELARDFVVGQAVHRVDIEANRGCEDEWLLHQHSDHVTAKNGRGYGADVLNTVTASAVYHTTLALPGRTSARDRLRRSKIGQSCGSKCFCQRLICRLERCKTPFPSEKKRFEGRKRLNLRRRDVSLTRSGLPLQLQTLNRF